jgi:hypothetical protein
VALAKAGRRADFSSEANDEADRLLAATLVTRDAVDLAAALRPLTGDLFARVVFSVGVLGMTISSITLQMVICGMVFAVVLGRPLTGWTFRLCICNGFGRGTASRDSWPSRSSPRTGKCCWPAAAMITRRGCG